MLCMHKLYSIRFNLAVSFQKYSNDHPVQFHHVLSDTLRNSEICEYLTFFVMHLIYKVSYDLKVFYRSYCRHI